MIPGHKVSSKPWTSSDIDSKPSSQIKTQNKCSLIKAEAKRLTCKLSKQILWNKRKQGENDVTPLLLGSWVSQGVGGDAKQAS